MKQVKCDFEFCVAESHVAIVSVRTFRHMYDNTLFFDCKSPAQISRG